MHDQSPMTEAERQAYRELAAAAARVQRLAEARKKRIRNKAATKKLEAAR